MVDLKLTGRVFESKSKTITIHKAIYNNEPCCAVVYEPTQHIEIFDYSLPIVNAVIAKIKRAGALVCEHKQSGRCFLKFHKVNNRRAERGITLRCFLYAKYHSIGLSHVRGCKLALVDDSAIQDGVLDLRSCNIYEAGASRPDKASCKMEIVNNPRNSSEKYITIAHTRRSSGNTEYVDYEPELYEMLSSSRYCSITANNYGDRLTVVVHYGKGKGCYIRDNLSKFVFLYYECFDKYRNRSGSIKRFLRDYPKLSKKHKDEDVAHVNACKWNSTKYNLMLMSDKTNAAMTDNIKLFGGSHAAHTTANEQKEILIEYAGRYFKCKTPEDYLDWQRVFLGKALTGKLQQLSVNTTDGMKQSLTMAGKMKTHTAAKHEPDFNVWLEHRNKMLSLPDNAFLIYDREAVRTLTGSMQLALAITECAFQQHRLVTADR